jgi:hypothetical protein
MINRMKGYRVSLPEIDFSCEALIEQSKEPEGFRGNNLITKTWPSQANLNKGDLTHGTAVSKDSS